MPKVLTYGGDTKIPNFDSKIFEEITGIKVEMNGGDDE